MKSSASRLALMGIVIGLAGGVAGCAGLGVSPANPGEGRAFSAREADGGAVTMDLERLERIFSDHVDAITGPSGALQTQVDGIPVYLISDERHDRMRIIAPIARVAGLDPRFQIVMLRANFHSTRDARYAISDDVVFAAFLHPISSISPELIASGLTQVVTLVKTFGTSFTSGEILFPGPSREEPGDEGKSDDSSPL